MSLAGALRVARVPRGRLLRVLLALCLLLLLLLVLAQLLLPGLAADRIASRLRRYGNVGNVSVSAWPAVELLWGSADSVTVRTGELRLSPSQTADRLWEGRDAERIDMTATSVREGPLRLTDVSLRKHGRQLSASGLASDADVQAALPPGLSVTLLGSEAGRVQVHAIGGLFGAQAAVDAVAEAKKGRLVAHPLGLLLEGAQLTLFSDPRVFVEDLGASRVGPPRRPGYRLSIRARLG
jgi:LmeA-like phospholipid-binding